MIRVSKSKQPGRTQYIAQWRDKSGKKIARGISTDNEVEADLIVASLQRILNLDRLQDPLAAEHVATNDKAYRAYFMQQKPDKFRAVITEFLPESIFTGGVPTAPVPTLPLKTPADAIPAERLLEVQFISEELTRAVTAAAEAQQRIDAAEERAAKAEKELAALRAENMRLMKAANKHCTKTFAEGVTDFTNGKNDVGAASKDRYLTALEDFQLYLGCLTEKEDYAAISVQDRNRAEPQRLLAAGGLFLISEIRGHHVDDFLNARLDKKTGEPITEKRKAALSRELSAPYHFWLRRYELTSNAFDHVQPLTGHEAVAPDSREMIQTVTDLKRLLRALDQEDEHGLYWQAFVATAALTGADLGQLFDLTAKDIIFEDPARIVMCRGKTGKQRNTPIERTVLLPILKKYSDDRGDSTFFFPSILNEGTKKRKVTVAGKWSGASAFGNAWERVAMRCQARIIKTHKLKAGAAEYCLLGPRAWRRTAVTMMNGAGCLPGQVARWVGHSVQIADRHYLGKVERNGLQFESNSENRQK